MDADYVTKKHRPAPELDIAADAAHALRVWLRQVREALVILDTPKYSDAIRGLVSWYERVFFDAEIRRTSPDRGSRRRRGRARSCRPANCLTSCARRCPLGHSGGRGTRLMAPVFLLLDKGLLLSARPRTGLSLPWRRRVANSTMHRVLDQKVDCNFGG